VPLEMVAIRIGSLVRRWNFPVQTKLADKCDANGSFLDMNVNNEIRRLKTEFFLNFSQVSR
jgi:hypothetical protein